MQQTEHKHFVTFFSPGTLMAESTTIPIEAWNTELACLMAHDITERHGAKPYGFRFETRIVSDPIPDGEGGTLNVEPKTVQRSGMHYIGGKVETLQEVEARATSRDRILVENMRCNKYNRIVTTANGYSWCQPFGNEDHVVDPVTGSVTL